LLLDLFLVNNIFINLLVDHKSSNASNGMVVQFQALFTMEKQTNLSSIMLHKFYIFFGGLI